MRFASKMPRSVSASIRSMSNPPSNSVGVVVVDAEDNAEDDVVITGGDTHSKGLCFFSAASPTLWCLLTKAKASQTIIDDDA